MFLKLITETEKALILQESEDQQVKRKSLNPNEKGYITDLNL